MRRYVPILAALIILVPGCGKKDEVGLKGPDRIACTMTDDFDTGELYAWESYPYTQDIGYDPRLLCQREPTHNGSRYAIARIVMPNDALDLSQGFTKQIDLWTTKDTHLRFALFLTSDRKPETVDVSLGLFDGRLYTHTVSSPEVNRWLEIDLPMKDFALDGEALRAGEHVQVIAIKAFYPLVTHLASYTILMDDVSINGERTRRFVAKNPQSTDFDMFGVSILNGHFFIGDDIGISVAPEGDRKLARVDCDVLTPDGNMAKADVPLYDDGTHGDDRAGDNVWTNGALHKVGEADPRGQWTLMLSGRSDGAPDVEWGIRVLVPGKQLAAGDHPRLFFSRSELDERIASDEPRAAKRILDSIVNSRDRYGNTDIDSIEEGQNLFEESLTGGPYSRVSASSGRWRRPMATLGAISESGAWKYTFNGDEKAGLKAKEALLKLCAFKAWNSPWMESHGRHMYFPVGYTTKQVGVAYDLLYPLLSDEERRIVRDAIMEKAIKPFYRDMVKMNRMPSNLSNHIAVIVSGMGIAATAIYGDDPANPSLEPYLSGIMTKMRAFMDRTYFPGGSYGEPYTYQSMASRDLTETLFAFERNFGVDYTTTTNLKDAWIYPLFVTHSNGRYQDFGDVSLRYGMTQTHMLWLTYRMKNPWTYAYAKPYYESGRGGHLGYLWYVDGIEPRYRKELPTSRLFEYKGNMVMRSDWEDDGTIMIFKCGPNSNHYHLDQGTFVIMTNGEELLSDAGHGSSYYANLNYPCYYTQAIGHNVMLVDMNPESQDIADYENGVAALRNYPRIVHHFASNIADEVEGDLTCVYKGVVSKYTRSLLYMKPGPVFLFDRVQSAEGHEYNWLFHAEHTDGENAIEFGDNTVTIKRPNASLSMDVLAPEIASHRIRNSDRDESFIALSSEPGLKETAFLAALLPESSPRPRGTMTSTLIETGGSIGARVDRGATVDVALFSLNGKSMEETVDGIDATAERFSVTMDRSGRVKKFFVKGTKLAKKGSAAMQFSSSEPVAAAVSYLPKSTELAVRSTMATEIVLSIPRSPSRVLSQGKPYDQWSYDNADKLFTVKMAKGMDLKIE